MGRQPKQKLINSFAFVGIRGAKRKKSLDVGFGPILVDGVRVVALM